MKTLKIFIIFLTLTIAGESKLAYISRINGASYVTQIDDKKILESSGNEVINTEHLKNCVVKKVGEINLIKCTEIAQNYVEKKFKISLHGKTPTWELVSAKIIDHDPDKGSRYYLVEFSSRDNSKREYEYSRDYLSIVVLFTGEIVSPVKDKK